MRGYLTLVLLLVGSLLSTTSQADHGIRVCQHAVQKYAYRLELAELILARTAAQYGETHIHPSTLPDPAQGWSPERSRLLARDCLGALLEWLEGA